MLQNVIGNLLCSSCLQEDELLSDPLLWNTDEYEELVRLQELRKVRLQCNNVEVSYYIISCRKHLTKLLLRMCVVT